MNATINQEEVKCCCGRTFPDQLRLQRHCKMLGQTHFELKEELPNSEPAVELPVAKKAVDHSSTYETALLVIAQKRMQLDRCDRIREAQALAQAKREAQRQYRNFFFTQLVTLLQMTAQNFFKKTVKVASLSLVAGFALLLVLALTTIGAHIGAAMA